MKEHERRGAQRVTLSPCGETGGEAGDEVGLSGMVHDLSASGMAFVSERSLSAGAALRVGFSLADPVANVTYPVDARVEVVRCQPQDGGLHRVAVRFTDLEEEGARHLREYLENLLILI
ncbi:PilZ domain-containing protein [Endothiovibrio diazotrophicus]